MEFSLSITELIIMFALRPVLCALCSVPLAPCPLPAALKNQDQVHCTKSH
jgi:hypothetical protein